MNIVRGSQGAEGDRALLNEAKKIILGEAGRPWQVMLTTYRQLSHIFVRQELQLCTLCCNLTDHEEEEVWSSVHLLGPLGTTSLRAKGSPQDQGYHPEKADRDQG